MAGKKSTLNKRTHSKGERRRDIAEEIKYGSEYFHDVDEVDEVDEVDDRSRQYDQNGVDQFGYTIKGLYSGHYSEYLVRRIENDEFCYNKKGINCLGFDVDGCHVDHRRRFKKRFFRFNKHGIDEDGFDVKGFDEEGFHRNGFNKEGLDKLGIQKRFFDKNGFNRKGFNRDGFNRSGFNREGFNKKGFNGDGFNRKGFNGDGFHRDGFHRDGFNRDGFGRDGFDIEGVDIRGFDKFGVYCDDEVLEPILSRFKATKPSSGTHMPMRRDEKLMEQGNEHKKSVKRKHHDHEIEEAMVEWAGDGYSFSSSSESDDDMSVDALLMQPQRPPLIFQFVREASSPQKGEGLLCEASSSRRIRKF